MPQVTLHNEHAEVHIRVESAPTSVPNVFALATGIQKWARRLFPALCRAWLQARLAEDLGPRHARDQAFAEGSPQGHFQGSLQGSLQCPKCGSRRAKRKSWRPRQVAVPRWVAFAMVALSSVLLGAGLLVTIVAFKTVGVGAPGDPVPWSLVARSSLYGYGGSLAMISIHHGLSLRLRGFEWPLGIGIVGMMFGTQVSLSSTYWPLLPWGYTTVATVVSDPEHRFWAIMLSGILAVLVGLVSGYDLTRRDIL